MERDREELKDMAVSVGTMRDEDLVPTFLDLLQHYEPERAQELREEANKLEMVTDQYGTRYADSDEAYWFMEDLWDAIRDIAPEGYSFGAHPGNGSDYGFWRIEEE